MEDKRGAGEAQPKLDDAAAAVEHEEQPAEADDGEDEEQREAVELRRVGGEGKTDDAVEESLALEEEELVVRVFLAFVEEHPEGEEKRLVENEGRQQRVHLPPFPFREDSHMSQTAVPHGDGASPLLDGLLLHCVRLLFSSSLEKELTSPPLGELILGKQ